MLTSLSAETFAAISIGLVIGLVVLLVLQIITGLRVQRLTQPLYEYARAQSQAEADRIVNDAREKSRTIVAESQTAVAALIERQHGDIEARALTYQKSLEELATAAKHAIDENSATARDTQAQLFQSIAHDVDAQGADIKSRMDHMQQELDSFLKQNQAQTGEISRVIAEGGKMIADGFKHTFEDVSAAGKKRIDERIEELLKESEAEVSGYREARKRLVDEHMADLVTETSKIVLRKALTPDEHAELVERALSDAHTAGMI
jgi:hypothetical protein